MAVLLLVLTLPSVAALGVSPARVALVDVLPGGYAEHAFQLSNPKNEPVTVTAIVEGEGASWFTVAIAEERLASLGVTQLTLGLAPPNDAEPREYHASLVLTSTPTSVPSGIANRLALTLVVPINFTIDSNALTSCVLGGFAVPTLEQGSQFQARYFIKNTGNTRVTPRGSLTVINLMTGDEVMRSSVIENAETLPTLTAEYPLRTSGTLAESEYEAELLIDACGEPRRTQFTVLEPGSLGEEGSFTALAAPEQPGGIVPLAASFTNTGERSVAARFEGVIERDGELYRVVETDQLLVAPGESVDLESLLSIAEPGEYVLRGRVVYENKRTEEKSVSIAVPEQRSEGSSLVLATILLLMALIGIVLLVLVHNKRNPPLKKRKH